MNDKLNRLPPALREKERYLKFKVHGEEEIELGELVDSVWDKVISYLGTKGTSEANFWIIGNQFNKKSQEGIVRVNRDNVEDFRAAITLIQKINDKKVAISIEKVSGSIKNLSSN